MNIELYKQFIAFKNCGNKTAARTALDSFIASFATLKQKREWAFLFLESKDYGHKIRHEIYENIVYPVLLDGYLNNDAQSIVWLAKTSAKLSEVKGLHRSLKNKTDFTFFKEAYTLKHEFETKISLLKALLEQFNYAQHEWSHGILYGVDGASIAECEIFLREGAFAKSIDYENDFMDFLSDFEMKVRKYMTRLL